MTLPTPEAGLVVSYSYLWYAEHAEGQQEGRKDRPCAIVLVVGDAERGRQRVLLLPITHSSPRDRNAAVEIPAIVKTRLGLDSDRSWIVLSEWNETLWPSTDLRGPPGAGADPRLMDSCRRASSITCGNSSWPSCEQGKLSA